MPHLEGLTNGLKDPNLRDALRMWVVCPMREGLGQPTSAESLPLPGFRSLGAKLA